MQCPRAVPVQAVSTGELTVRPNCLGDFTNKTRCKLCERISPTITTLWNPWQQHSKTIDFGTLEHLEHLEHLALDMPQFYPVSILHRIASALPFTRWTSTFTLARPTPASWEHANGHSKRSCIKLGQPLASWPAKMRSTVGLNFEHRDFMLNIDENKFGYTQLKKHTLWYTLNRSE